MSDTNDDVCPIPNPNLDDAGVAKIREAAELLASDDEIAAYAGITVLQLEEFYTDTVTQGLLAGKIWLRKRLKELAEGGDKEALKQLTKLVLTP